MNKTVIKGTPLQNSINERDEYLTTAKSDLLPRATSFQLENRKLKKRMKQ